MIGIKSRRPRWLPFFHPVPSPAADDACTAGENRSEGRLSQGTQPGEFPWKKQPAGPTFGERLKWATYLNLQKSWADVVLYFLGLRSR